MPRIGAGDPLNVVLIGELADIGAAMVRRNYRRDVTRGRPGATRVRTRSPDFVLRKQAQARRPATWIRAVGTPISFDGKPVYLAQVGRPVGGRFAAAMPRRHRCCTPMWTRRGTSWCRT